MNKTNYHFEMQNQQAGAELKQIECTKSFCIGFFVAFFDINNHAFRKTNSSGKTLDTRQKIFCAALLSWSFTSKQISKIVKKINLHFICSNYLAIQRFFQDYKSFYVTILPFNAAGILKSWKWGTRVTGCWFRLIGKEIMFHKICQSLSYRE